MTRNGNNKKMHKRKRKMRRKKREPGESVRGGCKGGARRCGAQKGGGPKVGDLKAGSPKFRAFFSLSCAHFRSSSLSLGVFSWKRRDPQTCTLRVLLLSCETPGLAFIVGRAVEERREEEEVKKERKLEQLMLELCSLLKVLVERRSHQQVSRITALLLVRER